MRTRYCRAVLILALALFAPAAYAQVFFTAQLTPAQQPGDVESEGIGTAALALTDEGLRFFVTVDSLTGPIVNAHFHAAEAGVDGPVVRGIMDDLIGNTASGIWTASDSEPLVDSLIADLFAGNLYLNFHTQNYPAGEIRGQILPSSGAGLRATLTAEQTFADVESEGRGTASVQVTDAGAIFFMTVDGLTGPITNAHFHTGTIGQSGPPVRGIMDELEGNTAFGLWTPGDGEPLTDSLRGLLLTGGLYLNFHTGMYPGGEIRGQVLSSSGWGFYASIDTAQVNAEVESPGSGTGSFTLTEQGLAYHITLDSLTGPITNAHFHHAPAGEDGGVVRTLLQDFRGNSAHGIWTQNDDEPLTDDLIRELLAGNIYVNVHTEAYQAGEIRGQVLLREGTEFTAHLDAEQEPGDVASEGRGTAALSLTNDGLEFRVSVSGLTGEIANAHFHRQQIGVNGGVVRGILADFSGPTASGVWTSADSEPLTDELIEALLRGELYLNVHTGDHPSGEIRGQVLPSEGTALRAFLTNEQADDEVSQEGSGTAAMMLTDHGLIYDVTVSGLTGEISNAHFHAGALGVPGGVVHGIADTLVGNTTFGVWTPGDGQPLVDSLVVALMSGELYLNFHTGMHPTGEVRGQVVPVSGLGAAVQLDPAQAGMDIESEGSGTAALTLSQAGLTYAMTVTGLTSRMTNAHFHNAPAGTSGGVVRSLFPEFDGHSVAGIWRPVDDEPLDPTMVDELLAGNIYINVHTETYGAGEIRGQVRPDGVVATAIERTSDEIPSAYRLEQITRTRSIRSRPLNSQCRNPVRQCSRSSMRWASAWLRSWMKSCRAEPTQSASMGGACPAGCTSTGSRPGISN